MSYKIKSLELINYIGIYSGIGINNIKIDFTNNENEIILLLGSNGSGKTTVLSNAHPFSSTYDNRDKIILEGLEGKKEIIYHNQDNEIIITHYYNVSFNKKKNEYEHKIRSYFVLNGEEKNENGTITSFTNLVEEYLGLTKEYFKVGKIGSNVTNFINLEPTERKQFLAKFLPDTDIYLAKNELAKKRFTETNRIFRFVSDELYKLGDVKEIVASKRLLEKEYNKNKEELESLNVARIEYETELKNAKKSGFVNELKDIEESPNRDTVDKLDKEINILSNITESYIGETNLNSIRTHLDYVLYVNKHKLDKEKLTLESDLVNIDNNISHKNEILSKPKELLLKKKNLLDKKEELSLEKQATEEELLDLEYKQSNSLYYVYDIFEKENNNKSIIKSIMDINNLLNFLNSYMVGKTFYELEDSHQLESYKELSGLRNKIKYNNERLIHLKEKLSICNKELVNTKKDLNTIYDLKKVLEDLHLEGCSSKSCPYETLLSKEQNYSNNITTLETDCDKIEESISFYEEQNSLISTLLECVDELSKLDYSILNIVYNEKYKDFFDIINKKDYYALAYYLKKLYKPIDLNPNILNDIYEAIKFNETLNNKLLELESNILEINADENFIKNTEEELILLKDKQKEIEVNINAINSNILENNTKTNELINSINKLENYKIDLSKLNESIQLRDELVKQDEEHNIKLKELIAIRTKWEEVKYSIVDKEEELNKIENNLNTYKLKIQRTKEYLATKKELEGKLLKINYIKESTDPKTGIPLEIIKDNIGTIKDITNKLLDIAYQGSFQIEDFIVTETEFLIQVRKPNGMITKDILECSQGEVALAKIAISLAILKKLLGNYNILYLDELDAELDHNNRQNFLNIINLLIKELHLEQVFVISHNDLFLENNAGLILFNKHTFDKDVYNNKTIIHDFTI